MCDSLTTKDGIVLRTLGDLLRYGINVPEWALDCAVAEEDRCLCWVDVPGVLAGHPSRWRPGLLMSGDGWDEVGPDGRTWWEGYDIHTPDPTIERAVTMSRSDGRRAMTLEQWEAARPARTGDAHV